MKRFAVYILAAGLCCCMATKTTKDPDKYTGSEPEKNYYPDKMGTDLRKQDNTTGIPNEFDKRR